MQETDVVYDPMIDLHHLINPKTKSNLLLFLYLSVQVSDARYAFFDFLVITTKFVRYELLISSNNLKGPSNLDGIIPSSTGLTHTIHLINSITEYALLCSSFDPWTWKLEFKVKPLKFARRESDWLSNFELAYLYHLLVLINIWDSHWFGSCVLLQVNAQIFNFVDPFENILQFVCKYLQSL